MELCCSPINVRINVLYRGKLSCLGEEYLTASFYLVLIYLKLAGGEGATAGARYFVRLPAVYGSMLNQGLTFT